MTRPLTFSCLKDWVFNVFPETSGDLLFDCRTGWDKANLFCNLAVTILDSSNCGVVVGGAAVVQLSHGGQIPSRGDGHSSPKQQREVVENII